MGRSDLFKFFSLVLLIFIGGNVLAQSPEKITFYQEKVHLKSAEKIIRDFYTNLNTIKDLGNSEKQEFILSIIDGSFVDNNVIVCNDLDITGKTEKYKKIEDYLAGIDLLFPNSSVEIVLDSFIISKIFSSSSDSADDKFLFVKGEVKRVLSLSFNDTVNNRDVKKSYSTILDVYVKFGRGKTGHKIYSIKEHEDNLSEFKLVTIDSGQSSESLGADTANSQQGSLNIKPGQFFLNSVPQGATIDFLDYPDFGRKATPATLTYPAGKYKVQLTKDDYDTIVDFISFSDKSRIFKLVPNFSMVNFDIFPENAEVFLNGSRVNESYINGTQKKVPKGRVVADIIADHYHKRSIEFQTLPGSVFTIKETLRPKNGLLTLRAVNSGADGASVFIDNILKGKLPLSDSLLEGRYTIRVSKPGYRNYIKSINIEENKLADFDVSLFSDVKLKIITNPSNAIISIDGNEIGNSNLTTMVSIGAHEITIKKDFYNVLREKIVVQDNSKVQELSFYLTALTNSVEVTSSPGNALVSIGGISQGTTPLFTSKEKGNYGFSIRKSGYFPRKFRGKIGGGQNVFHRKLYPKNVFNVNLIYGLNSMGAELGGNISYFSLGIDLFGIFNNDIHKASVSNEVARLQFDPNYLTSTNLKYSAKDTSSIGICIKGGIVLLQPFIMRLHVGVGLRSFLYHKVYQATDNAVAYNEERLSATNIQKGGLYVGKEFFSDDFQTLTLGIQVPLRHLNLGADYWVKTEKGGGFMFRIGYNFF
jgi:hypothetical protein